MAAQFLAADHPIYHDHQAGPELVAIAQTRAYTRVKFLQPVNDLSNRLALNIDVFYTPGQIAQHGRDPNKRHRFTFPTRLPARAPGTSAGG